ncbi:MAG: hypothetical protein AB7P03_15800 [Kofleriaceae bacterium]
MAVIARDPVASDHLVYQWPYPVGTECEVACGQDEHVVMCPAWVVADQFGPGRHRWRSPDPMRPASVYFVLTAPVEVSFDMTTRFVIPATGEPVRLRASGALAVRVADPVLLVAQFVGIPSEQINAGLIKSVARSVERMLARLLTRRVVLSGTAVAVTEAGMLPGIIEELVAYNPAAGAVFGIELSRMGHLVIAADNGSTPFLALPERNLDWSSSHFKLPPIQPNGGHHELPVGNTADPAVPMAGLAPAVQAPPSPAGEQIDHEPELVSIVEDEPPANRNTSSVSGEIVVKPKDHKPKQPPPIPRKGAAVEKTKRTESTRPGPAPAPKLPLPAAARETQKMPAAAIGAPPPVPSGTQPREAILGIGMSVIGATPAATSAVPNTPAATSPAPNTPAATSPAPNTPAAQGPTAAPKARVTSAHAQIAPGRRVLIPGPDGMLQSATVRQQLHNYYELEIGNGGETVWVPASGVVPE